MSQKAQKKNTIMSSEKTLSSYLAEESSKHIETLISEHCIPHFISYMEQRIEDGKTKVPTKKEMQEYFAINSYVAPVVSGGGGSKKPLKDETLAKYNAICGGTHDYKFDRKRCIRYKAFSDTFCAKGVAKNQKLCDACYKLPSSDKLVEEIKRDGFSLDKYYAACVEKSTTKAKKSLGTNEKTSSKSSIIRPPPDKKKTAVASSSEKKTLTSTGIIPRPYKKGPSDTVCFWIKINVDTEAIIVDSNVNLVGVAKSSINPMLPATDTAKVIFKNNIKDIRKAIESKVPKQEEKKEEVKSSKSVENDDDNEEESHKHDEDDEEEDEEPIVEVKKSPARTVNRTINPRAKAQPKKEEKFEEVSDEADNLEPEEDDEEREDSNFSAEDVSEEEIEEDLSDY